MRLDGLKETFGTVRSFFSSFAFSLASHLLFDFFRSLHSTPSPRSPISYHRLFPQRIIQFPRHMYTRIYIYTFGDIIIGYSATFCSLLTAVARGLVEISATLNQIQFFFFFFVKLSDRNSRETEKMHLCAARARGDSPNRQAPRSHGLGIETLWLFHSFFFCDLIYFFIRRSRQKYEPETVFFSFITVAPFSGYIFHTFTNMIHQILIAVI